MTSDTTTLLHRLGLGFGLGLGLGMLALLGLLRWPGTAAQAQGEAPIQVRATGQFALVDAQDQYRAFLGHGKDGRTLLMLWDRNDAVRLIAWLSGNEVTVKVNDQAESCRHLLSITPGDDPGYATFTDRKTIGGCLALDGQPLMKLSDGQSDRSLELSLLEKSGGLAKFLDGQGVLRVRLASTEQHGSMLSLARDEKVDRAALVVLPTEFMQLSSLSLNMTSRMQFSASVTGDQESLLSANDVHGDTRVQQGYLPAALPGDASGRKPGPYYWMFTGGSHPTAIWAMPPLR